MILIISILRRRFGIQEELGLGLTWDCPKCCGPTSKEIVNYITVPQIPHIRVKSVSHDSTRLPKRVSLDASDAFLRLIAKRASDS